MKRRIGNLVIALLLIAFGLWLIAGEVGARLPGLEQSWPVIPVGLGLAMLAQYVGGGRREIGLMFVGLWLLLTGAFLFLFTFHVAGITWADIDKYWPGFPLIVAAAFLALYMVGGMRARSLLVPTFLAGGAGILALPFTLGVIRGELINQVAQLWPLLILLLGAALIFRPRGGGES
jgi:hypothetical protein